MIYIVSLFGLNMDSSFVRYLQCNFLKNRGKAIISTKMESYLMELFKYSI